MPTGVYKRTPFNVWKPRPIEERFFDKVIKKDENSCWNWIGAKTGGRPSNPGYGTISLNCKDISVHRFSYEFHNGEKIPEGTCVCHKCDNPLCVNPKHLFLGSYYVNTHDAVCKNRMAFGTKHGRAKLTENQVRLIRKLRKRGFSGLHLEKMFGVNHVTIYRLCKGVIWRRTK